MAPELTIGARYLGEGRCRFRVWAPRANKVELCLVSSPPRCIPLEDAGGGYFSGLVEAAEPGALYTYRLDGQEPRPDPASRYQPQGVHGPSQVTNPDFAWTDQGWRGIPLARYVIYELHVGTYSAAGTFDGVAERLGPLRELGITAVELMPVAQFPGNRNWGYDGVQPFAVQNSYGGPEGLKRLIDACHRHGLAVVLDVVYNHLGPEGNYLAEFGPYFTDRYRTPWGHAINFDGPDSDEVRGYFGENALYWVREFHVDALRLDAVHAIFDQSARPFLQELACAVHEEARQCGRSIYVISESDLNDPRIIASTQQGGFGHDAQWNDDFHHALHTVLTGERQGYYQDFGELSGLERAIREGYVYSGRYSRYRRRRHGAASRDLPAERFVVFSQNHDQVGNRMLGERLSQLVGFEALKLAAGAVVLAPAIPLLFMGEEYAEPAPFLYFVDHSDAALIQAVRNGRREEFAGFAWKGEPPDPQDQATFGRSTLDHDLKRHGRHAVLLSFYRELLRLRAASAALSQLSREHTEASTIQGTRVLWMRRWSENEQVLVVFNFADQAAAAAVPVPEGRWRKRLDSAEGAWGGNGSKLPTQLVGGKATPLPLSAWSFVIFVNQDSR